MTADVTEATTLTEAGPSKRVGRSKRIGVVESASRDKTIKVRIDRLMKHPKYGKYLKRKTTLHAHDEKNEAKTGDLVEIVECRPLSKTKSWRLSRLINQGSKSRAVARP